MEIARSVFIVKVLSFNNFSDVALGRGGDRSGFKFTGPCRSAGPWSVCGPTVRSRCPLSMSHRHRMVTAARSSPPEHGSQPSEGGCQSCPGRCKQNRESTKGYSR